MVDEDLVAGCMMLTHAPSLQPLPGTVALGELGVAVSPSADALDVLGPQPLQRHPLPLELLMDLEPVRLDEPRRGVRGGGEETALERRLVEPFRQWPGADADGGGQGDVLADRPLGEPDGAGNLGVAEPRVVLEAQDLGDLGHGHPRLRHLGSVSVGDGAR